MSNDKVQSSNEFQNSYDPKENIDINAFDIDLTFGF